MLSVIQYLFRLDSTLTSTILLYLNLDVGRMMDALFAFVEQTSQDVLQLWCRQHPVKFLYNTGGLVTAASAMSRLELCFTFMIF